MEGFFWLLLQTLPLLTAAAVVFFILGWRWRGLKSLGQEKQQISQIDAENIDAETARRERDTARDLEEKLRLKLTQAQTELQESQDRQTLLQKEILRLSDELKESRQKEPADQQALESIQQALVAEKKAFLKLQEELKAVQTQASVSAKKPRATKKTTAKPRKSKAKKSGDTPQ